MTFLEAAAEEMGSLEGDVSEAEGVASDAETAGRDASEAEDEESGGQGTQGGGVVLQVTTRDFKQFAKALRRSSRTLATQLRRELRAAGMEVATEVKRNASYSSRIQRSVKVRTSGAGVSVVAGGSAAPEAAVIENGGKGHVRHPTFGHTPWTSQNSKPAFFAPALRAKSEVAVRAALNALDRAVSEAVRL